MKLNPYKHKEKYLDWKEENKDATGHCFLLLLSMKTAKLIKASLKVLLKTLKQQFPMTWQNSACKFY